MPFKCSLTAPALIPSIITILFVKRKGLKMTGAWMIDRRGSSGGQRGSASSNGGFYQKYFNHAQLFNSAKNWNVKVWDRGYDWLRVAPLPEWLFGSSPSSSEALQFFISVRLLVWRKGRKKGRKRNSGLDVIFQSYSKLKTLECHHLLLLLPFFLSCRNCFSNMSAEWT